MRSRSLQRAAVFAGVLAASMPAFSPVAAATQAPDWVDVSRKRPVPDSAKKAPVVVLLDEMMVEVTKSEERARARQAVRLQGSASGLPLVARQRIGQKFKLAGAWKVRPDGTVTPYQTSSIVQYDADGRSEFSMSKYNVFKPDETRIGDLLAWEYELRAKPEAYSLNWLFVGNAPTLVSRFGVKMPVGWSIRSKTLNHADLQSSVDDDGYTVWQMRDLPAPKEEPLAVPSVDLAPRLMVGYGMGPASPNLRHFETWESVSKWYSDIVAPQVATDETVKQAASRAAAGAATKMDAIRAVTRFVQGVRYLNVAAGRSVAEPHPAPLILENRFGDCEDKTVLTIALLREIGVGAHPVLALTSDAGAVIPDFPAPNQFNHAIAAIEAPADAELPSVLDASRLGRLIIFDPTSTNTGLGDLPWYLQGTHAVVSHEAHGGLVTLPVLPPESSSRESEIRVSFAGQGGVDVAASISYAGQYGAARRAHFETVRGDKRKQELTSWLVSRYGKADVRKLDVKGVEQPGEPIEVDLDLWMSLPGKEVSDLRTMAATFILGSRAERLNETERATPLRIEAAYQELDRTTIEVPPGWKPAMPLVSMEASCSLGTYRIQARSEGTTVVIDRGLTVRAATVPTTEYTPVKRFFDEVIKGDSASLVFERAAP